MASCVVDWVVDEFGYVLNNTSPGTMLDSGQDASRNPLLNIPSVLSLVIADSILVRITFYTRAPESQIFRYGAALYCGKADMSELS